MFRQEPLFPMEAEAPDDRSDTAFIDRRHIVHDGREITVRPGMFQDFHLNGKGDLGVGNDGGRQQGMGTAARTAEDSADAEPQRRIAGFDGAFIVPMDSKGAGTAAGTGQLVERKGTDDIVINFLRNRLAKINKNGYHKYMHWVYECEMTRSVCISPVYVLVTGNQTLVGEVPVTFVYSNILMITEGSV